MKFIRVVAVYIINDDNEFLFLEHKRLKVWMPPGGKIDNNEMTHQAAIREVLEETGLEIEFVYDSKILKSKIDGCSEKRALILPQPIIVQQDDTGDAILEDFIYLARPKTKEIVNNEASKIGQIKWFKFEDALKLNTFENIKIQLEYIKDKLELS